MFNMALTFLLINYITSLQIEASILQYENPFIEKERIDIDDIGFSRPPQNIDDIDFSRPPQDIDDIGFSRPPQNIDDIGFSRPPQNIDDIVLDRLLRGKKIFVNSRLLHSFFAIILLFNRKRELFRKRNRDYR